MKILKQLRALTHAPLKDCKNALEASENDINGAQERLKERGAIKAAKSADRETNEGIVLVTNEGGKVVSLKLACETDFVAKNDTFKGLAKQINDLVRNYGAEYASYDELSQEQKDELNKVLQDSFVTVGENMRIIDVFAKTANAYVYAHPGDKVVAVIYYTGEEEAAKKVALQVAAMNPTYFTRDDVDAEYIASMKAEFMEEMKESGKPEAILEKIVEGKVNKQMSEVVLMEQVSIFDDSKKVGQLLGDTVVIGYTRVSIAG